MAPNATAGPTRPPSHPPRIAAVTAPVVLVHGFATSSARTWGDNGWLDLLARRRARRRSPIDLLGHGTADKPHDPAAYAAMEQLVARPAARRTGRRHRVQPRRPRAAHARRATTRSGSAASCSPAWAPTSSAPRAATSSSGPSRARATPPTRSCSTSPGWPSTPRSTARPWPPACGRRDRRSPPSGWPPSTSPCSSSSATRTSPAPASRSPTRCPRRRARHAPQRRPLRHAEGLRLHRRRPRLPRRRPVSAR